MDCSICLHTIDSGKKGLVQCKNKTHSICFECLPSTVESQSSFANLQRNGNRFACPILACSSAPWSLSDVIKWTHRTSRNLAIRKFEEYTALAVSTKEEEERNRPAVDVKVDVIRQKFLDALNLSCPKCMQVFVDYSDCDRLQCSRCLCCFCAICLMQFPTPAECYVHLDGVHKRRFGGLDNFNRAHKERRHAIVIKFMSECVGPTWVRDFIESVRKNLTDISLDPDAILKEYIRKAGEAFPVPTPAPSPVPNVSKTTSKVSKSSTPKSAAKESKGKPVSLKKMPAKALTAEVDEPIPKNNITGFKAARSLNYMEDDESDDYGNYENIPLNARKFAVAKRRKNYPPVVTVLKLLTSATARLRCHSISFVLDAPGGEDTVPVAMHDHVGKYSFVHRGSLDVPTLNVPILERLQEFCTTFGYNMNAIDEALLNDIYRMDEIQLQINGA